MELIDIKTEFLQENALNQTCRVCLCTGSLLSLVQPKIVKFFQNLLHTNIYNDNLPKTICLTCLKQLETTMGFIEKCRDSHDFLLRLITTQELIHHEEILIKEEGYELIDRNKCPNCGELVTDLIAHFHSQKNCYPKIPKCPYCDASFATIRSLEKHLSISHGIRREVHECRLCGGQFGTAENLKNHMDYHVLDQDDEEEITIVTEPQSPPKAPSNCFKCTQCNKEYFSRIGLKRHELKHNPEKYILCTICDRKFLHNSELILHNQMHTKQKLFKCGECNRNFTRKTYVRRHYRMVHLNERPFQCSYCGRKFASNNTLIVHERIHTGEKPFQCTKCNEAFLTKHKLTVHKECHEMDRKFAIKPNQLKCHLCTKQYNCHKSLKRHILKFHNFTTLKGTKTTRKVLCPYCDKEIVEEFLNNHINNIHLGIKMYKCDLCDKKYAYKSNLSAHVKSSHFNE